MARGKRIGVVIPSGNAYGHQVATGIGAELANRPSWMVRLFGGRLDLLEVLEQWGADGVIARIASPNYAKFLSGASFPVVNFSGIQTEPCYPGVATDDLGVGAMAADHLLSLSLKQFAFYGGPGGKVEPRRKEGFFACLQANGVDRARLHYLASEANRVDGDQEDHRVAQWLLDVPKPCGILAIDDASANYLGHIARESGVDIPNEIALLGVGDDPLMCHLTVPALSSVRLPCHQIGVKVAQLLVGLMDGQAPPAEPITLPPTGVAARGSTDMLAVDDPDVAAAISLIRQQSLNGLTVKELMDLTPLPRRTLERKFHELCNRSPAQEIRRIRVEHAKTLLMETDLTMPQIAAECSFHDAAYFSRVFSRAIGVAPSQWRRLHRPPR